MKTYWFPQKRYGYGAGLPLTWHGWAVMAAFLAIVGVAVWISVIRPHTAPWMLAGIFGLTVPFVLVCHAKTRGGWRWRWGSDPAP